MVFFTCNHCGDSVKKPAVEKHYNTKCRGATESVSCMDCLKDFYGKDYRAHTKCISEIQKYSGKDYVHKEAKNSGAKKQEGWMGIIRAILDSSDYKLSGQARDAFERLQSVDNVPRKKAKFQNFVKNCMHMPVRLAEEVWSVLEKEQEKMKVQKQQEKAVEHMNGGSEKPNVNGVKREATAENGHDEPAKKKTKKEKKAKSDDNPSKVADAAKEPVEVTKKKSKKKKATTEGEVVAPTEINGNNATNSKKTKKNKIEQDVAPTIEMATNDTTLEANVEDGNAFEWSAILEKIVRKSTEGITLDKLKKRVIKRYAAKLGADELTEKQQKKFEKKFAKNLKISTALQLKGEIVMAC